MKYRVGLPGWRFLARRGVPLSMRVDIHFDPESKTYWANSPDLDGLVVEGQSFDELRSEVQSATILLLELSEQGQNVRQPRYVYRDEARCPA